MPVLVALFVNKLDSITEGSEYYPALSVVPSIMTHALVVYKVIIS